MRGIKTTITSILALGLLAGSAVGVAAQDEEADPMRPAVFKTDFRGGDYLEGTVTETEQGQSLRGASLVDARFEAGDARASGRLDFVQNEERVGRVGVLRTEVRIVNDAGSWTGPLTTVQTLKAPDKRAGGPPFSRLTTIGTLTGDGAYAGLTLFITSTGPGENVGYIIPTDLVPPVPEWPAELPAE